MTTKPNQGQLQYLNPRQYALWDEFALAHPQATLFHTTAWAEVIRTVFGRPFRIVADLNTDDINCGMLFWPKKNLRISAITRAPLTPYQGILHNLPETAKNSTRRSRYQINSERITRFLKNDYPFIDLPLYPGVDDVRPFIWNGCTAQPHYTYRFKITAFEQLQQQFSQSLRRKINAAEKENLQVVQSDHSADLIRFVCDSYRHHGRRPPVGQGQIEHLFRIINEKEIGEIYYLKKDDKNIAGLCILTDKRRIYTLFAGIDYRYRNSEYSALLYVKVLQQQRFIGSELDFLGADLPEFEQFKRSFGGELCLYFSINYTKNTLYKSLANLRVMQQLFKRRLPGKAE